MTQLPCLSWISGKKISLKTIAAASEYSWKSMNSIAVPSQPETAAFFRSLVLRVTISFRSRALDELAETEAERDLRLERRHAGGQESEEAAAR